MSSVQRTLELVWIVCYQAIQKMRQKRFFRCPLVDGVCVLFLLTFFFAVHLCTTSFFFAQVHLCTTSYA